MLSRFILYKLLGWKKLVSIPQPKKCIICLAPHTSNWDFIIGKLFACSEGLKSNFLMKKEWFVGPLGIIFKKMGGIPVWRNKHCSMTDQLASLASHTPNFQLCITPEGTRSINAEWKKGFYYIALKANIPIILYALDYQSKTIYCNKMIIPNGDIDEQMKEIKQYFKDFKGKNPEKFTVGDI
ncbi:1-acyl-sn-glycerol-3-phosphate acyltransferase [Prevotella amnii]|jgi:acyltransferase|uniref:1-acyl-sn-glycerol-3-phosphate acyltransferase n=1 Tax=Prevotella amnii TaxID=419005 RepID=UPI0028043686|nr:1-acyl-sn-glycerol-3-phosphate acyltransferase [uncultured Prevotella sp.]